MTLIECHIIQTLQELSVFCWYRGCWPNSNWVQYLGRFLYVLRSVNDGAIDWYNEVPALIAGTESMEHWV